MTNFYNPFQQRPLTTTNRASRRERLRQLQRARERGLATQVNQAQAPVVLAEPTIIPTETGDIRQQYPIVSPQMLPERQAEFQTQQAVQRPTALPFGVSTPTVYSKQAKQEERFKPEFGSYFGSGILENIARFGLGTLENVQKGIETVGGTAIRSISWIPGDLLGYESTLKQLKEERGGGPGFWNVAGQAQLSAEAFRRTDMPTTNVDIIPGAGLNLPGDATLNRVDIGVKGAIELLPDAILAAFTGGSSLGRGVATKALPKIVRGTGRGLLGAVGGDILIGAVKNTNRTLRRLTEATPEVRQTMASPNAADYLDVQFNQLKKQTGGTVYGQDKNNPSQLKLIELEAPSPKEVNYGYYVKHPDTGEEVFIKYQDTAARIEEEQSKSLIFDLVNRSPEKFKGPLTWTINRLAGHGLMLDTSNKLDVAAAGLMRNQAINDNLVLFANASLMKNLGFTSMADLADLRLQMKGAGHSEEQLGILAKKAEEIGDRLRRTSSEDAGDIVGMDFIPGGMVSLRKLTKAQREAVLTPTPVMPLDIPLEQIERIKVKTPEAPEGLRTDKFTEVRVPVWQGQPEFRTVDGQAWNKVVTQFWANDERTVSKYADMTGFKPRYIDKETGEEIVEGIVEKVREIRALPSPGFREKLKLHQPRTGGKMRWRSQGPETQHWRSVTAGGRIVDIKATTRDDFRQKGSVVWNVHSTKFVNGKIVEGQNLTEGFDRMNLAEAKAWASDNFDARFADMADEAKTREIVDFIENDALEFIPSSLGGPRAAKEAIDKHLLTFPMEFAGEAKPGLYRKIGLEEYTEVMPPARMENALLDGYVPDYTGLDRRSGAARLAERNTKIANFAFHYQNGVIEMSRMMLREGVLEMKLLKGATKRTRGIEKLRFSTDIWVPRMTIPGTNKSVDAFSWLANQGHDANNFSVNMVGADTPNLKRRSINDSNITHMIENGYIEYEDPFQTYSNFIRGGYKVISEHYIQRTARRIAKSESSQIINYIQGKAIARSAIATLSRGVGKSGKISKVRPETIKKLRNQGFSTVAGRIEKLNDLNDVQRADGLKELMGVLNTEAKKIQNTFYKADARGPLPALAGMMFRSKDEMERTVKLLGQEKPGLLETTAVAAAEFGDTLRLGKTGFDAGFHMIQGLPGLGLAASTFLQSPVKGARMFHQWGRSLGRVYEGVFTPEVLTRQIIENMDVLEEAISKGRLQLSRGATDIYLSLRGKTTFHRIPKVGKEMDDLVKTIAKPFEKAFVAPGDLLRIEYYKILRGEAFAREGEGGLAKLGSFLNKMTGSLNPLDQGIVPTQSAVERNILFFSQRYTRAAVGLMKSFFEGGIEGELARRSITGMAGLGIGTYWALSEALKQAGVEHEAHLDPSKSDFMTFNINGDLVGIGSFWTQMARLTSKLSQTAWDEDAQADFGTWDDNPIVRFIRGRSAPSGGVAWDALTSSDYMGRQLTTPWDWTKHLGKSVAPIWAEAAFLDSPYKTGPVATLGEVVGGRVRPLSASERRSNLRDDIAVDLYDAEWHDLNKLQQQRIRNFQDVSEADALKLEELDILIREGRDERGDELELLIDRYWDRKKAIDKDWKYSIATGNAFLEDGLITPGQFKEIHVEPANAERRSRMENELHSTAEGAEFADVIQHFEESALRWGVDHPEDVAYAEYIRKVIANPDFEDVDGFDHRAQDREEQAFRIKWGDETYAYVHEIFNEGRELPIAVYELYQGKKHFEYYWKDAENVVLERSPNSEILTGLWERWLDIDNADERKELERLNPIITTFRNTVSNVRKEMRRQDAQLETWLYRWGYVDPKGPLLHRENQWEGIKSWARTPGAMPLDSFGIVPGIRG